MKGLVLAAATAGAAAMAAAAPANAAVFDFSGAAPPPAVLCPTQAPSCSVGGGDISNFSTLTFTTGGQTVDVTANGGNNPYYDLTGASGSRTGLGVDAPNSSGGNNEQIDNGDVLTFTFGSAIGLVSALVYNGDHQLFSGQIKVNSTDLTVTNGVVNLASLTAASVYNFAWKGTDYYVGQLSTVPLPGAVLLFGSALAGLGVARRRKAQAAAA